MIAAAVIIVAALAVGAYLLSRRSAEVGAERRAVHENTMQTEGRTGPANVASLPASAAPAAFPEKSIAVLPFENLSDEKQNAYFTDGVQDEILTDLAKIADLKVISRTSVMQYQTGGARNLRE